jgi:hypothetical protein
VPATSDTSQASAHQCGDAHMRLRTRYFWMLDRYMHAAFAPFGPGRLIPQHICRLNLNPGLLRSCAYGAFALLLHGGLARMLRIKVYALITELWVPELLQMWNKLFTITRGGVIRAIKGPTQSGETYSGAFRLPCAYLSRYVEVYR